MVDNWKDVISRRLREREERELQIEKIINKVDGEINVLIRELKSEYHVKADVESKYTSQGEQY